MKKHSRFVKVMAWILSLIMVGSMGTLVVSLLIQALSH